MENQNKKIFFGIDLIKSLAAFFVVGVHFFLHTGFYCSSLSKGYILFYGIIRYLFFSCVPLFIITTGFLRIKTKLSKNYYKKLLGILITYLFISVICILFKIFYLKLPLDFFSGFFSITNFSADNYGWYVSMYLGLALLIPFLNGMYFCNDEKKSKLILIGILVLLCSIFALGFYYVHNETNYMIFSEYWVFLYPFCYYFIGGYIKEYSPKVNKLYLALILLLTLVFETVYTLLVYKTVFPGVLFGEYNSITVMIVSVCIFLLLYDCEIKNQTLSCIFRFISKNTLEIYLFSYITDTIIYSQGSKYFSTFVEYSPYMVLFVILSFVSSVILASLKMFLFNAIKKLSKGKAKVGNEIR